MGNLRENSLMRMQNDEIDLMNLLKMIYNGRKVIIIFATIGALLGLGSGFVLDKRVNKTYTGSIEFLYKPEKIKSSEELKLYAFDVYILNALLKKDGVLPKNGGYKTPTITLGDNAIRFNNTDRYSYLLYIRDSEEKNILREAEIYYNKFIEEAILLNYNKDNFYKLNEKVSVVEPKKKMNFLFALGIILGVISGVVIVFFKEFWEYFKKELN